MKTKAQIAQKKYGCSLSSLSSGEKAAVTRVYNAQSTGATRPASTGSGNYATVEFGRPSINGVKKAIVKKGTCMGDALKQSGLSINAKKEGVLDKDTGRVVMFKDAVVDGSTYIIVPGIDSQ